MRQLHIDRIRKLIAHLRGGKLGHEIFDMRVFNDAPGCDEISEIACGTRGCALGECPVIWPRSWAFIKDGVTLIRRSRDDGYDFGHAAHWFGIEYDEAGYLFDDGCSPRLLHSPKLVALHIERFLKRKLATEAKK